mmetsp:Transcript_7120/g.12499  ORF Transcript_7120/g.12499 Transcript_7120/m.12499 type:complete len:324 (+) Transcript_7120:301-1272(+)|eukprot:CAMPEP_0184513268 /NCGR_PEP_ID=MMETSP0198_2-20121128/3333_1 /TAXON_ID=1112570 /ORGANISM="Thraustochytrium sp., Strain LLF1b" /LENGTH=323 /DNA_ID=CAMNT_0026903367 /DNA_START=262 /DNA_END=1233 /DNA_ORIENTATION=-
MDILREVQATSDDAAVSKLSAITKGYLDDPFLRLFVGKEARRSPLINRGYYARVKAMDMVIDRFLESTKGKCQIVALGAGSDTTFFRFKSKGKAPTKYVEVDLEGVVTKKLSVLAHNENLRELAGVSMEDVAATAEKVTTAVLQSEFYALACADLRDAPSFEQVLAKVNGFSMEIPTLFISECVLCYVDPPASSALLSWVRSTFPVAALVSYEQILPDDAFGRTMIGHFETRGCPLLAIHEYPDIKAQEKRFTSLGWSRAQALDMNDIYYKCIDKEDLQRAERLEIFDEFEEWHLMQGHYCVVLAVHENTGVEPKVLEKLCLM